MPDKNKLAVFSKTRMTIFKSCTLCHHGEIPENAWGVCKHPDHFFDHTRHGRLPGVAHASMGCDDFHMMNATSHDMATLGPYIELIPMHDDEVDEVGVEQDDEDTGRLADSVVADDHADGVEDGKSNDPLDTESPVVQGGEDVK